MEPIMVSPGCQAIGRAVRQPPRTQRRLLLETIIQGRGPAVEQGWRPICWFTAPQDALQGQQLVEYQLGLPCRVVSERIVRLAYPPVALQRVPEVR